MHKRRYISPKDSKALVDLAKLAWPLIMRLRHGDVKLKVLGDGLQRFKKLKRDRVVICPNHCSEDDAETMFGLSRLLDEDFNYLTAHEMFHGNRGWNRLLLPRLGCYSIERGTKDIAAYKMTRDLLISNKHKIVVFPEGEISHLNEFVMPLERGVAQISFAALEKLQSSGKEESILILPVAIRYFSSENMDAQMDQVLTEIEIRLNLCMLEGQPSSSRAKRSLLQYISSLERRFDVLTAPDVDFPLRMTTLRWRILRKVAADLRMPLPDSESQVECAHTIKSKLCDLFYKHSDSGDTKFSITNLKSLYRELLVAIKFIAIEHSTVVQNLEAASQDEVAEIVEILEASLLKTVSVRGSRLILAQIGSPIDLLNYQAAYRKNKISTVREIDDAIRAQLQKMLVELNQFYRASSSGDK